MMVIGTDTMKWYVVAFVIWKRTLNLYLLCLVIADWGHLCLRGVAVEVVWNGVYDRGVLFCVRQSILRHGHHWAAVAEGQSPETALSLGVLCGDLLCGLCLFGDYDLPLFWRPHGEPMHFGLARVYGLWRCRWTARLGHDCVVVCSEGNHFFGSMGAMITHLSELKIVLEKYEKHSFEG